MKLFRHVVLLGVVSLGTFVFVGCGSDEDTLEERVPVSFVSATPPGGAIAANGTITVTFDGEPEDVTVSAGTVTVAGKTATIAGPFVPGPLALTITWKDGTQTLNYGLCCDIDGIPPEITGGTVKDGDTDVDPQRLNTDGIEVIFTEDVTGTIALQTEAGEDVGWLGEVKDTQATLTLVKGREIGNQTTYRIVGNVSDFVGNETQIRITFVTQAKE